MEVVHLVNRNFDDTKKRFSCYTRGFLSKSNYLPTIVFSCSHNRGNPYRQFKSC